MSNSFATWWTIAHQWVASSFSRGSSWPRDQTRVSCIGRQILCHWATREAWSEHKSKVPQSFASLTHHTYRMSIQSYTKGRDWFQGRTRNHCIPIHKIKPLKETVQHGFCFFTIKLSDYHLIFLQSIWMFCSIYNSQDMKAT